jgi:hypothetical protein
VELTNTDLRETDDSGSRITVKAPDFLTKLTNR